jgi:adenylate cyclase
LRGTSEQALIQGMAERLVAAGVPLLRANLGLDTLHPIIEGWTVLWTREAAESRRSDYDRQTSDSAAWERSPFFELEQSGQPVLRRRLGDGSYRAGEFPLLDEIVAAGATDYLAYVTRFEDPDALGEIDGLYSSWSTDAPAGFTPAQVELIEGALPVLALALKAESQAWVARELLETYLGRDAGRRVVKGEIERGATQTLPAILWFSDLRGFTRIADTLPKAELVPLLNDYADVLASVVNDHGGQVLKFMGDGMLAFFALDHDACDRALDAAEAALMRIGELNDRRAGAGKATTGFGLGLHVGEVLYGNIGSVDRLDFTVVGPAVNEAARIEAMCASLDQTVVVSEVFARAEPACRNRLVSLGRYMLKGVARPQELFTLDPTAGETSTN